ncbi:MAG: UbiD family decarboxylase [Oscillospiraceae bacterium]|nr:UbiD family decarboxylase [Oscillospiraceae bacterium]
MKGQMMRAVLEHLDAKGQLKRCTKRVNAKFELGAVLTHFNNEQPILFTDVDGSSVPVAGGIYGNREIICDLLGTTVQDASRC